MCKNFLKNGLILDVCRLNAFEEIRFECENGRNAVLKYADIKSHPVKKCETIGKKKVKNLLRAWFYRMIYCRFSTSSFSSNTKICCPERLGKKNSFET